MNTTELKYFFIIGAGDPEMEYIENILKGIGVKYAYATLDGKRVKPFSANKADGVSSPVPKDMEVVFVECRVKGINPAKIVDHHAPGDPGFGKLPEEFMEASSLGQILEILKLNVSDASKILDLNQEDILSCMAADHCLSAAYKGKCPGVDPKYLEKWRAKTRAKFQGIKYDKILALIKEAKNVIKNLPDFELDKDIFVKDARVLKDTCPELPEASAQLGYPVLYRMVMQGRIKRDGIKIGLLNASKKEVEAFFKWAEKEGLKCPYGDPERGFAGAYEELPERLKD